MDVGGNRPAVYGAYGPDKHKDPRLSRIPKATTQFDRLSGTPKQLLALDGIQNYEPELSVEGIDIPNLVERSDFYEPFVFRPAFIILRLALEDVPVPTQAIVSYV